jgi:hypothetical protein
MQWAIDSSGALPMLERWTQNGLIDPFLEIEGVRRHEKVQAVAEQAFEEITPQSEVGS